MTATPDIPVSVVVPVYRHTPYLEPAIRSILALDYDALQIVIIDDASPDDAFDVVRALVRAYTGPHKIVLHRNDTNLSMGTYNALMDRAAADHIVVAHDDDIQYPHRVRRVMEAYAANDVSMVACNAVNMRSKDGKRRLMLRDRTERKVPLLEVARHGRPPEAQGAALSWRREVFDRFGPISVERTARTSDYILPFRAALLNGVHFVNEPLLDRRVHLDSRGKIGHRPGDKEVTSVEVASEGITQLSCLLDTLDSFAEQNPTRADELAVVRANLILRLEDLARELGTNRNRLHMRKLRMSWIGHAPLQPETPVPQPDQPPEPVSVPAPDPGAEPPGPGTATGLFRSLRTLLRPTRRAKPHGPR